MDAMQWNKFVIYFRNIPISTSENIQMCVNWGCCFASFFLLYGNIPDSPVFRFILLNAVNLSWFFFRLFLNFIAVADKLSCILKSAKIDISLWKGFFFQQNVTRSVGVKKSLFPSKRDCLEIRLIVPNRHISIGSK